VLFGVLYAENFLPKPAFLRLQDACTVARKDLREEPDCLAEGRRFNELEYDTEIVKTLCSAEAQKKLNTMLGTKDLRLAVDTPPELRSYGKGASMDWHRDDQLYTVPQYECVFTVENHSDSKTEWIDEDNILHSHWTPPNSIIAFKAQDAMHRVTPLGEGRRDIVKFVLTSTHERTDDYYELVPRRFWHLGLSVPL